MGASVLILGGSYFIGKKTASVFHQNGYCVSVLNRGTKPTDVGIEQITCDRNDAEGLRTVLKGRKFDYVIDVSWKDITWVKSICEALSFDSVKNFFFLSSSAVYDIENLEAPFHETDNLAPNKYWASYGQNKIEAEAYYTGFLADKSTDLIILRPPYVFGEDNYAQRESLMFKHLCAENPILIPYKDPQLQFIYTTDLANIILNLLQQQNDKVSIYNVGNSNALTASEWVEACACITGKTAKIIKCNYQVIKRSERDFFPFFDYDNVLDVSKIKAIVPNETPFEEGLASPYRWYEENKNSIVFKQSIEKNINEIIIDMS